MVEMQAKIDIVMYGGMIGFNFVGGHANALDPLKRFSGMEAVQVAILAYDMILKDPRGGQDKASQFFNQLAGTS